MIVDCLRTDFYQIYAMIWKNAKLQLRQKKFCCCQLFLPLLLLLFVFLFDAGIKEITKSTIVKDDVVSFGDSSVALDLEDIQSYANLNNFSFVPDVVLYSTPKESSGEMTDDFVQSYDSDITPNHFHSVYSEIDQDRFIYEMFEDFVEKTVDPNNLAVGGLTFHSKSSYTVQYEAYQAPVESEEQRGDVQYPYYSTSSTFCDLVNDLLKTEQCESLFVVSLMNYAHQVLFNRTIRTKVAQTPIDKELLENKKVLGNGFETFIGMVYSLILLFPLPIYMYTLVMEKEKRIKELLKLMGLKERNYVLSNYISFIAHYILVNCILFYVWGVVFQHRLFTQTSFWLMLLVFIGCGLSVTSLAFFLSTFLEKVVQGTLLGCFVMLFSALMSVFTRYMISEGVLYYKSFLIISPLQVVDVMSAMMIRCDQMNCMSLETIFTSTNFLISMIMLFLNSIVYFALALYLQQVIPKEVGRAKHPLFFLCCFKPLIRFLCHRLTFLKDMGRIRFLSFLVNDDLSLLLNNKRYEENENVDAHVKDLIHEIEKGDTINEHNRMVLVKGAIKKFGKHHALKRLFFEVRPNEAYGLLGMNGAGKSTIMSILTGVFGPSNSDEHVFVNGKSISHIQNIRDNVGFVPQFSILYDCLTAREHLHFLSLFQGRPGGWKGKKKEEDNDVVSVEELEELEEEKYTFCGDCVIFRVIYEFVISFVKGMIFTSDEVIQLLKKVDLYKTTGFDMKKKKKKTNEEKEEEEHWMKIMMKEGFEFLKKCKSLFCCVCCCCDCYFLKRKEKLVSEMSGGMRRRLAIAISFIGDPGLLILDEPTTGLDPLSRRKVWNLLMEAKSSQNKTLLISSHSMEEVETVCDRVGMMNEGRLICCGNILALKDQYASSYDCKIRIDSSSKRRMLTKVDKEEEEEEEDKKSDSIGSSLKKKSNSILSILSGRSSNSIKQQQQYVNPIEEGKKFLEGLEYCDVELIHEYESLLQFEMKPLEEEKDENQIFKISRLFMDMENAKSMGIIDDWEVNRTSMDAVFLNVLAKDQKYLFSLKKKKYEKKIQNIFGEEEEEENSSFVEEEEVIEVEEEEVEMEDFSVDGEEKDVNSFEEINNEDGEQEEEKSSSEEEGESNNSPTTKNSEEEEDNDNMFEIQDDEKSSDHDSTTTTSSSKEEEEEEYIEEDPQQQEDNDDDTSDSNYITGGLEDFLKISKEHLIPFLIFGIGKYLFKVMTCCCICLRFSDQLTQYLVLTKKNLILYRIQWKFCCFLLFFPIIVSALVFLYYVIVVSSYDRDYYVHPSTFEPNHGFSTPCVSWTKSKKCYHFVYTTNGSPSAKNVMDKIMRTDEFSEYGDEMEYMELSNSQDLFKFQVKHPNSTLVGIEFDSSFDVFDEELEYILFFNHTSMINMLTLERADVPNVLPFWKSLIDRTIVSIQNGDSQIPPMELTLKRFPKIPSEFLTFIKASIMSQILPINFMLLLCFYLIVILSRLVAEKESKQYLNMKIMGLSDIPYLCSYYVLYTIFSVLVCLVFVLGGYIFQFDVIISCDFLVCFSLFFFFFQTTLAYPFILWRIMQTRKTAVLVAFLMCIPFIIIGIFTGGTDMTALPYHEDVSPLLPYVINLILPVFAFQKAFAEIAYLVSPVFDREKNEFVKYQDFGWGDFWKPQEFRDVDLQNNEFFRKIDNVPFYYSYLWLFYHIALGLFVVFVVQRINFSCLFPREFCLNMIDKCCCSFSKRTNIDVSLFKNTLLRIIKLIKNEEEEQDNNSSTSDEQSSEDVFQDTAVQSKSDDEKDPQELVSLIQKKDLEDEKTLASKKDMFLRIKGLKKLYFSSGKFVRAVDGLNLSCRERVCLSILGHNGAGKTTTLGCASTMVKATSGSIYIKNKKVGKSNARRFLGVCNQYDILYDELTPTQHLMLFLGIKQSGAIWSSWKNWCLLSGCYDLFWNGLCCLCSNLAKFSPKNSTTATCENEEVERLLNALSLYDVRNDKVKTFSGGMKRRLSVAISLIGDPEAVILDEPTTGMDPFSRSEVWDLIHQLKREKVVILTSHSMEEVSALANKISIMKRGKLMCVGTPLSLKAKYGTGYNLKVIVEDQELKLDDSLELRKRQVLECVREECSGKVIADNGPNLLFRVEYGQIEGLIRVLKVFEDHHHHHEEEGRNFVGKIRNFGVGQCTLEDVYLSITGDNNNEEEMDSNGSVEMENVEDIVHEESDALSDDISSDLNKKEEEYIGEDDDCEEEEEIEDENVDDESNDEEIDQSSSSSPSTTTTNNEIEEEEKDFMEDLVIEEVEKEEEEIIEDEN